MDSIKYLVDGIKNLPKEIKHIKLNLSNNNLENNDNMMDLG